MRSYVEGCPWVEGYHLLMEDGRYKIAGEWNGPSEEYDEWSSYEGYPRADRVTRGTGAGAVVDYTRAVERADVAQLDDLLSASGEARKALFENVYEAQRSISSFNILSEEVYGWFTVQARVEVVFGSDEENVFVFELVMDDEFWSITAIK